MDERIDQLESQIAFQDDTIHQLNEELTRQGQEIARLKQEIEYLKQKYQEIRVSAVRPEDQETPPPHY